LSFNSNAAERLDIKRGTQQCRRAGEQFLALFNADYAEISTGYSDASRLDKSSCAPG